MKRLGCAFRLYPSLYLVGDRVVLFVGLLRGAIVCWKGHLNRRQIELETAVDLYAEWNSKEMRPAANGI